MEKITVNSKVYQIPELDFEFLVVLNKNGVALGDLGGVAGLNSFVSYCSGLDEKEASKEITNHIIAGGSMEDLFSAYSEALENSGFFRKILGTDEKEQKTEEKNTQKTSRSKKVASE